MKWFFFFYFLGQAYLSWAFSSKQEEEKEATEDAKTRKKRLNLELARALAVLGVKASTFHSLHYGGKKKKVKQLLEKHLIDRTKESNEKTAEEMESEFNINFEATDLATIHEAYQFLVKKYVEDADKFKNENFLTPEELREMHEKKKKKRKNREKEKEKEKDGDEDFGDKIKGRRSR